LIKGYLLTYLLNRVNTTV